ncbi:efflux RND transporter permease subunit [Rhodopila globiformis]|uniref:Nodulation protein n=1 Tax=Rhodopila globiformis TaxID=1071 RepID=A0A2S6NK33_RHOGL|nr:efflux RND transporter permease subunit [Rhodopila globiformis]PPQ35270.1 nodulation protein [Rhodopila globiformis]
MNLSALFIARPVATTLLTIAVLLAGLVAYFGLPVAPLPQIDMPTILVQARQPGASPAIMGSSVAAPLERHLAAIADVSEMTSQSFTGLTRITLQFGLDRDIDGAARDVQAAINAAHADLPATLRSNPIYRLVNLADAPVLVLALTSATLTQAQLFDAADSVLRQRLSQLPGVGDVDMAGASLPAVRIETNPDALAELGISMEDLRAAAASANANSPKGMVEFAGHRLQIAVNDRIRRASDLREIIVGWRQGTQPGAHTRAPVRLSDVAAVTDSVENLRNAGLANGKPAVLLMLYRQPAANIIAIADEVRALLPELTAALPADASLAITVDRSTTIRASLADMREALLLAIGLVVLVVVVFLRSLRAAAIPAVAVVVSISGTFGVMCLLGYSIDNLSLMALIVATGFVVDDAIVVLENIERHMAEGLPRRAAALAGTREVGFTVVSISLSLIAALLPILAMGGLVGRMFREFAVTLSVAVLVSLVVSLSTTPMMCVVLLRPGAAAKRGAAGGMRLYGRSLDWALRHRLFMGGILLACVGATLVVFHSMPKGFFPQQDTGRLVGKLIGDQSASFQLMREKLSQFEQVMREDPAVGSVVGFTGGRQTNAGSLFISLKPLAQRGVSADAVITRLRPRLSRVAGARLYLTAVQDLHLGGRSSNAQFQYTLRGDSEAAVQGAADRLVAALRKSRALVDVNSDLQFRGLSAMLHIDRDAAAAHGLTPVLIDNALYDAFGQRQVSTIYDALNQYHVVLEAAPAYWQDPAMLDRLFIGTVGAPPAGTSVTAGIAAGPVEGLARQVSVRIGATPAPGAAQQEASNAIAAVGRGGEASAAPISPAMEPMVPLRAVARWQRGIAPIVVNHQGLEAAATISFNLPPGGTLAGAVAAITAAVARIGLPASVHGAFAGAAAAFQASQRTEALLIVAALVTIYIVLGILYESFLHPLTILSTLPPAVIGAMLALRVTGTPFTVVALIAVILLLGIVKKNGIMLVDFALSNQRERGLSAAEAVRDACLKRVRPILMTTLTAVLGAVPLSVGGGEGAALRHPLGIAVIGGLLLSQLLTLYTTPVVYTFMAGARHGVRRVRNWS